MKKAALLFFIIIFSSVITLLAEEAGKGWISGQLKTKNGDPMSGGMVVFFNDEEGPPPSPDRYTRVPDEIGELDGEGKFRLELPAGKYYLGAIKRVSGEKIGPPLDGDYFFISRDKGGKPLAYLIEKDRNISIGVISEAVPFKRTIPEGVTGISGTIVDLSGDPVEGAIVFAYITETMTGIPPFTSYRTGQDGKYIITVDKGGQYFLRVRDVYGGGPPVPGAIMGGYGEERPAAVTVKTGEVAGGLNIKVIRHLEMGPRGQHGGTGVDKSAQEEMKKKTKEEMEKKK
ncbi:MAG: carboxypeptidase regulatory-like domain-containing protein [Nitrospirae bacterium]|nr:carboxypeptidase regulatory-like domain-containing protein [Nitrospirota bacterium]